MFKRQQGMGAPAPAPAAAPAAEERIGTRFTMRQRLFTFDDDFWVENERGQRIVRVDGKLFRARDTLNFEDAQGRALYHITARLVDARETIDIQRPNGAPAAVVHNAWFSPARDRWKIEVPGSPDLEATGNILQHEYAVRRGGRAPVAIISMKWLRVRDTYGVEVRDAEDAPLLLAITVAIDMMSHNGPGGTNTGSMLDAL